MLIRHRNHEPQIHASAYVAPTAAIVGRVSVGARCRVMYGAVLDAEGSNIVIGECSIINENAVLRATGDAHDFPVLLGIMSWSDRTLSWRVAISEGVRISQPASPSCRELYYARELP